VLYPDIEEELKEWIKQQRGKKNHVSVKRLICEGRKRARIKNYEKLKFSWGWVKGFLKRNLFKLKKPSPAINKSLNSVEEDIRKFKEKMKNLIQSNNYDLDFVLNIDETGIPTELLRSKTITFAEENKENYTNEMKEGGVKTLNKEKEMTTALIGGTWTDKKIRALVILPGKGVKKLKLNPPECLRIQFREEGSYMDRKEMGKWVTYILRPFAAKLPSDKRGLLLLDNFKGHISPEIEKNINCYRFDVLKLPPNTTKYLQPLDLSTNRSLKSLYSEKWENYLANLEEDDLTKAGNFKPPSRETKLDWIGYAWDNIKEETIKNGWNVYKMYIYGESGDSNNQRNNIQETTNAESSDHQEERKVEENQEDNQNPITDLNSIENLEDARFDSEGSETSDNEEDECDNLGQGIQVVHSEFLDYVIVQEAELNLSE